MAAKFFTGLPLDGPDPECVNGHGEALLAGVGAGATPRPAMDHSRRAAPLPARSRSSAADDAAIRLRPSAGRPPTLAMKLLEPARARAADGAEPGAVRPARHQPRRRRPPLHRPPRRLLRAPGPRRVRDDRRRGGQRPRVRLAVRAGPAGRRRRAPAGRRSSPPAGRTARSSSPRSTTPAGKARRPTASARCGHRRGSPRSPRREVPKWMEADDIAAVVAGFGAAAASCR